MAKPTTASKPVDGPKPGSIWDNDLPAGDAPPLPAWPLKVAVATYVVWLIVLVSMMVLRLSTT